MAGPCGQRLLRRRHVAALVVVVLVLLTSFWVQIPLIVVRRDRSHGDLSAAQPPAVTTAVVAAGVNVVRSGIVVGRQTTNGDVEGVLTARREHYEAVCDAMQASGGVPGMVQNPMVYLPANLSVCWVPKVGCTFWMRIFFYLYEDTQSPWNPKPVRNPLDVDRLFVHYDGGGQHTKALRFDDAHDRDVIFTTTRVMFARDPWSRLWSGYIDKFILPDSWLDHGKRILRLREESVTNTTRGNSSRAVSGSGKAGSLTNRTGYATQLCADDVSFAEFLHYALVVNHDLHWSPVHLTCNPCLLRPQVVGKLETFLADSAHVLRSSGLLHLLPDDSWGHATHVRDEMKLLADYHFRLRERRPALHSCLSRTGLARRLWTAFQLNGYLPASSPFPEFPLSHQMDEFSLFDARDIFTNRVVAEASLVTQSRAEWLALRRAALVEAYRDVPVETLRLLQDRFSLDFRLFGYDAAPSDLFAGRV